MGVREYTEARERANKKWDAKNQDHVNIVLPKGYRDKLRERAGEKNTTVNRLLRDLIEAELGIAQ